MKKLKLDSYEKEIVAAFERGELIESKDSVELKKELVKSAKYTLAKLKKTRNVNFRLADADWNGVKIKAAENGLPYQTLISMLLHQYVTGKINIIL